MKLALLLTALPLLIATSPIPAVKTVTLPNVTTVCQLKNMAARREHAAGIVEVTAIAYYDFEYGYYLADFGCADPLDGTGALQIEFPANSRVEDFPELAKVSSQSWLAGAVGKTIRCTCIGTVSLADGNVTFTLKLAKMVRAYD